MHKRLTGIVSLDIHVISLNEKYLKVFCFFHIFPLKNILIKNILTHASYMGVICWVKFTELYA